MHDSNHACLYFTPYQSLSSPEPIGQLFPAPLSLPPQDSWCIAWSAFGAVSFSVYLPALIIVISNKRNNTNTSPITTHIIFVLLPPIYSFTHRCFFLLEKYPAEKYPAEYFPLIVIPHTISYLFAINAVLIKYGFSFPLPRCGTEYVGLA